MAKKKNTMEDDLVSVLMAILLVVIGGAYFVTQSLWITGIIAFIVFIAIKLLADGRIRRKQALIVKSGILEIDKMTGVEFEEYLKLFFEKKGFRVKTTPKSGDFGADLILEKKSQRIAVQAKRYSSTVGLKAVQEVNGAKKVYQAHKTWVVTNNYYTDAAKKLAKSNGVILVDRDQLIKWIS